MNILFRRLFIIFRILMFISFIVCLSAFVIFILDINGSKGLIPVVFASLFAFFYSTAMLNFIHSVSYGTRRVAFYKNVNFVLGSVSLFCFILSLFVFWM